MTTDRFTVRAVVIGLLVVALAIVAALTYGLAVVDLSPEERTAIVTALITLGSTALGAVAGLLAKTSSAPEPGEVAGGE